MLEEKLLKIINNNEDIAIIDIDLNEQQKIVFSYFVYHVKKLNLNTNKISLLINYFFLELTRGSIVTRYLNGENIDLECLNNSVEILINDIIYNYFENDDYKKINKLNMFKKNIK